MKTQILNGMKERRSVRAFRSEQIRDDELNAVLEAGLYAASGRGAQATKMVVVQDRETRELLSKWNAEALGVEFDPFYGAPTFVVVFSDKNRTTCIEDGALVIGNLMLAAFAVGLGSCWIHRAKEVFSKSQGRELARKWGVSDDYVGVGHCALGYAAQPLAEAAPRKRENIIRV